MGLNFSTAPQLTLPEDLCVSNPMTRQNTLQMLLYDLFSDMIVFFVAVDDQQTCQRSVITQETPEAIRILWF